MRKRKYVILLLIMQLMIFTFLTAADYGSGNYISSAPVKPTTGLKFYVDYSAITTYGSSPFTTAAYDWNGNYKANVAQVVMYPASQPTDNFVIGAGAMTYNHPGETFYYTINGDLIDSNYALDSTSIYRCSIRINSNSSVFDNPNVSNRTYLEKTIRHEIGHVFLLKHPSIQYGSVMHSGVPTPFGSVLSTVSTNDRQNLIAKWGL